MVKSEDFDLGNFGRNTPDSSSKFLGAVGGAVVDTQVDSDTGDYVLPISQVSVWFPGGGVVKSKNHLPLFLISGKIVLSRSLCLGLIGKKEGQRFCLQTNCVVRSHGVTKFVLSKGGAGAGICSSPGRAPRTSCESNLLFSSLPFRLPFVNFLFRGRSPSTRGWRHSIFCAKIRKVTKDWRHFWVQPWRMGRFECCIINVK